VCAKQQNLDALKRKALDVSTPGSAAYGQYLSVEAVDELTAPAPEDLATVEAWLRAHDVSFSRNRACFEATASADVVSKLFSAELHVHERAADKRRKVLAAGELAMPPRVAAAVESVIGLKGVPLPPRKVLKSPKNDDDEGGDPAAVTPTVLAQTYKVSGVDVNRSSGIHQAVAEFQGEYMRKSDLTDFFKAEVPDMQTGDDEVAAFVGANYTEGSGVEAALDIEFIMGAAPGVKTEFWEWPDMDFCQDLQGFTDALLKDGAPAVMSISYGWQGDLSEVGCDAGVQATVDANWAKLAAAGRSVMISSGDSGSACASDNCNAKNQRPGKKVLFGKVAMNTTAGSADGCCQTSDMLDGAAFTWTSAPVGYGQCVIYSSAKGLGRADANTTSGGPAVVEADYTFYPSWPASSPWVTAVGATRFVGQKVGGEEMASDQFGSGGGFSAEWDRSNATWQEDAVQAYLAQGSTLDKFPPDGSFPVGGRGTPDVSALGEGYQVYENGDVTSVGGTSASSPAFAGFVSLLNEARIAAGKPLMGFLNPFLYANADAFFDVVKGTNAIGRGTGPLEYGFAAAPGWDPATGLGTPLFDKLLDAALAA